VYKRQVLKKILRKTMAHIKIKEGDKIC